MKMRLPLVTRLLTLFACLVAAPPRSAAAGLSLQAVPPVPGGPLVLNLTGFNPDWVYTLQASPAPGRVPFAPVVTGVPYQMSFTVPAPAGSAMFYRAMGTNLYGHPLAPGAVAGPAARPAMGFNSWFAYSVGISETNMMATADAMATNGMVAAGYQYLVLDQGWTAQGRYPDGTPMIRTNFPHGMKYLADYVHSKGLKLGLYTSPDTNYHGFIASGGHVAQDALLFAQWGVDYVKFDTDSRSATEVFANAFLSTGRPLWLAPTYGNFESWIPSETSSWRGNGGLHGATDLSPTGGPGGDGVLVSGWEILLEHIDYLAQYADSVGPGHWNDPDAGDVNVFNAPFTKPEMAMFSILACNMMWDGVPLADGVPADALFYLTNSEVIAVHQDAAGLVGRPVATNDTGLGQVWCRPLGAANGAVKAVCFLNRDNLNPQTISVNWSTLGLTNGSALVRDLFQHANLGHFTNGYTVTLEPQDCLLVSVTAGAPPFLHPGTNYLSDQGYLVGFTNGSASLFQYVGTVWPAKDLADSGTPMRLHGRVYPKGLGTDANAWVQYALGGLASSFHAEIGIDDLFTTRAQAVFRVWLDGAVIYESGILAPGSPIQVLDLPVAGGQLLTLQVVTAEPGGETANDVCDWANAYVVCP